MRSPKLSAALVMIAWLATLVSFWGIGDSGRRAIAKDENCTAGDIRGKALRLEMAPTAQAAVEHLGRRPYSVARPGSLAAKRAACIQRGVVAQVRADYLFIPAYAALTLALFLFVRSLRGAPRWTWAFVAAGLLLAATMCVGDLRENRQLERIIGLSARAQPAEDLIQPLLATARSNAFVKMGALALSALFLGTFWKSRTRPLFAWVPRLLGFAAAALLIAATAPCRGIAIPGLEDWELAALGMSVFAAFTFTGLIHAIAVASEPQPPDVPEVVQVEGDRSHE